MNAEIAKWLIGLAAYVALDWATFTPALAPLGITPWNPAIGLAVAMVIAGGRLFMPLLAIAPFLGDVLVRGLPLPWWVTGIEAALTGVGYALGLVVLLRPRTGFDRTLHSLRDMLLLGGLGAASSALVAVGYSLVLAALGYLPAERLLESILRYWVGEVIGQMVVTPFLLLMAFRREFPRVSLEGLLQGGAILGAVAIVVWAASRPALQLSFLLLLPIMWLAVRYGFEGAAAGLLMMQVCLMVALHIAGVEEADVTQFQAVMVMLAISGLATGLLISERHEDERRLRLQQDAMARAARLGSMGEFAAAMAHELNQPLTAAGNYARAALAALDVQAPRIDDARHAAERLIVQVDRSAQVMRRLRELIRVGRIDVAPQRIDRLLRECLDLMRPELQKHPIEINVAAEPRLPRVAIDLLQIEQVVLNLMRNAMDALVEAGTERPRITIAARRASSTDVEITVADNGPGFPPGFDPLGNQGLSSAKPDGLGVGLALCRSIVTAHGGALAVERRGGGASVRFTVPIAAEKADE